MKRLIALALFIAAGIACGPEIDTFNQAVDLDRTGREKMTAALSLLVEYNSLRGSTDAELLAQAELKKSEALDAYRIAVASWDEAKSIYERLIAASSDSADYRNNLGTLLMMEVKTGLIGDYEAAERAILDAIAIHDRPLYRRNLEILQSLRGEDGELIEEVRENKRIVEELRQIAAK
jgi:tetratricopeptide (TPR) repeat protein